MKRAKIIKESLYDYLTEKGYSYISDRNTWVFRKKEGELEKEIVIHDMYGAAVKFDFGTTVGGTDGIPYMDKNAVRINSLGFCEYENEEEFRAIIAEIKKVIVTQGKEIFEEISVISEEQRLNWEMQKQLFENHEQYIEKGRTYLGIKEEKGEELLNLIIERLKSLQGKSLQEVEEELFMLSAVYGQLYVEEFEGEWVYVYERCGVESKAMYHVPLTEIRLEWEENSDDSYKIMISNYNYSVDEYNRALKLRKK